MKRLLFFILFLSLLVSFGNEGWVKLYKLKQFERSLEEENRSLTEASAALHQEIKNLNEADYLNHFIRSEIGFVRENELIYEFVGGSVKKEP